MPEYLAPGVYVEEVSFRPKSIEGVTTSTTAFVGLTRRGPASVAPRLVTSFSEFERLYGGLNDLAFTPAVNYLAHAARAFFHEGGQRLFISRVIAASSTSATSSNLIPGKTCRFGAAFVGEAGNGQVALTVVATGFARDALSLLPEGSLVRINRLKPQFAVKHAGVWHDAANLAKKCRLTMVAATMDLLTLKVMATDRDGFVVTHDGLGFDPLHPRYAGAVISATAAEHGGPDAPWFCLELSGDVSALDLMRVSEPEAGQGMKVIPLGSGPDAQVGSDAVPLLEEWTDALARLRFIEDIAIVAAPGHTEFFATAEAVTAALVCHAEARGAWRFAVLDVPRGRTPTEAQADKWRVDSSFAALYYPWVVVTNPSGAGEIFLPPSGFVCGIYARSDAERGVHHAPANEVVRGALRFERVVSEGDQEILNPAGVNCLRFFTGRGHRVWGARTTASDPEWKYINVRRYCIYLEHSITRGTQWAVFEPNDEPLWANLRQVIESFLYNEWVNGALLGDKPERAYFVKCDRSTMTQDDLDHGRLACLVGVAVVRPAEFINFCIGQWTADAQK